MQDYAISMHDYRRQGPLRGSPQLPPFRLSGHLQRMLVSMCSLGLPRVGESLLCVVFFFSLIAPIMLVWLFSVNPLTTILWSRHTDANFFIGLFYEIGIRMQILSVVLWDDRKFPVALHESHTRMSREPHKGESWATQEWVMSATQGWVMNTSYLFSPPVFCRWSFFLTILEMKL